MYQPKPIIWVTFFLFVHQFNSGAYFLILLLLFSAYSFFLAINIWKYLSCTDASCLSSECFLLYLNAFFTQISRNKNFVLAHFFALTFEKIFFLCLFAAHFDNVIYLLTSLRNKFKCSRFLSDLRIEKCIVDIDL